MKTLYYSLILFCAVHLLPAQDSLTVEQTVQRVLETHPLLQQAEANVHAAEARTAVSQSPLYPSVNASAQYTRIGPIPSVMFGLENFPFAPVNNYDAHVTADYTVYDFNKTHADVDVTHSRIQSMRDAIDLTRTGLALQAIRTFYSLIFLQRSLIVQNEQIDALNQHLTLTQKRVNAGSATNFDVLTTQVRVAAAQNQQTEIENSIQKQTSILRELLGLPVGCALAVRGMLTQDHMSLKLDSLLHLAAERRVEIQLARDAEQTALFQKHASEHGNSPALKIGAQYGIKNGLEPNLDAWRGNWAVFAGVQIPIYDGSRTKHQTEEAQAVLEAEQAHTNDVSNQIHTEVEQAVADVQAAETKMQISKVQLQHAREAVTIARTRYEVGTITNLDLLDAETAESSAKLTDLQALYQYIISTYQLQTAVGTLVSK